MREKNVLYLVVSKKTEKCSYHGSCKAIKFLERNNIPFEKRYVEVLSKEDLKYIMNIIELDCFDIVNDAYCRRSLLGELLVNETSRTKMDYIPFNNYIKGCNIKLNFNSKTEDREFTKNLLSMFGNLINLPIIIKDEIALVGFNNDDYQQFILYDRNDPKWMIDIPLINDEEKVDWIIKNLTSLREAQCYFTQLYLPSTSQIYGGKINWVYPKNTIINGKIIRYIKKIPITIQVEIGSVYKEYNYFINVTI